MEPDFDITKFIEREIIHLCGRIELSPRDLALYSQRGKLYFKLGIFDKALNDFLKIEELDEKNEESREYIRLIRDIFEFRHSDIYNP